MKEFILVDKDRPVSLQNKAAKTLLCDNVKLTNNTQQNRKGGVTLRIDSKLNEIKKWHFISQHESDYEDYNKANTKERKQCKMTKQLTNHFGEKSKVMIILIKNTAVATTIKNDVPK